MPVEFDHKPARDELISYATEEDSSDPRSCSYERKLTYPHIRWPIIIVNAFAFCLGAVALILALWFSTGILWLTVVIPLGTSVLYLFVRAKSVMVFGIECYQLLAPARIRMRCRFEPSCSDYAIASIRKYGAWRGLVRSIKRVRRCKPPNGGYDYP